MKNQKLLGVALLVAGVIILYFGWRSSESVSDQVTEAFTGRFTDETMIFIIGGAVALVAGIYMTLRK